MFQRRVSKDYKERKKREQQRRISRAPDSCAVSSYRDLTPLDDFFLLLSLSLSLSLPFIRQTVQLRFDGIVFEELFFQFHPVYFRGKQWSRCSRNQFSRSLKSPRFDSMIPGLIIDYSGIVFSSEIRSVRDNVRFRGTWFSFTPR